MQILETPCRKVIYKELSLVGMENTKLVKASKYPAIRPEIGLLVQKITVAEKSDTRLEMYKILRHTLI